MSLIDLYNPLKTPEDFTFFASANFADHIIVLEALNRQKSIFIPLLDISVLDLSNPDIWALNHQALHNSTNSALQIAGSDFTQIHFNDPEQLENMKQLHADEHRQWHLSLDLV